jgi:hypothetical protein
VATASQRILLALGNSEKDFGYLGLDDIESFYKMALRYFNPFALPKKCPNIHLDAQGLYRIWSEKPNVWILENMTAYDEMYRFIRDALFGNLDIDSLFMAVKIDDPPMTPRLKRVQSPPAATHGTPYEKRK